MMLYISITSCNAKYSTVNLQCPYHPLLVLQCPFPYVSSLLTYAYIVSSSHPHVEPLVVVYLSWQVASSNTSLS